MNNRKAHLCCNIRNAYEDALEILKEHARLKGVVHFFTGTVGTGGEKVFSILDL